LPKLIGQLSWTMPQFIYDMIVSTRRQHGGVPQRAWPSGSGRPRTP
jgi:hypothetical protein